MILLTDCPLKLAASLGKPYALGRVRQVCYDADGLVDSTLHLQDNAVTFSACGLPMVGNLDTGGVIGLTKEGAELCARLASTGVPAGEVPESCGVLVAHLDRGGYLASSRPERPGWPALSSAYLHVTQRCNLACRFCYSEDETRNASADPPLDNLNRAIRMLASMGCKRLVVSGGEPFLRDDLDRIASRAKGHGIENTCILTNGTLITHERVEPLRDMVDSIAVAFDGCSQDSPAHLRGKQRFNQLVEAIRVVDSCGIAPVILPAIHAKNLDDMPRYKELATSLGAKLQFSLLTAPNKDLGSLAFDAEQLRRLAALSMQDGTAVQDSAIGGHIAVRRSCGAGVRTLSVAADGTVYPCHMLHQPAFAMGNAFTATAEQVLSSDVARSFGGLSVDSLEGCSSCEVRYLCGGGCRAHAFLNTGCIKDSDNHCKLYKIYFNALINRIKV